MKIKVIGKAHMEGNSKKTGKPYNLTVIHYNSKARNVEGEAAQQIMLPATDYPVENITVGQTYNVEFDQHGFCVEFSRVG